MKLAEIKTALVSQFFKSSDNGIPQLEVSAVFESLSKHLDADLTSLAEQEVEQELNASGNSSDPSKAFKRFTDGRRALLTINEDDGQSSRAIFAAIRVGTKVMYSNLTTDPRVEQKGNLASVKQALKQAKNINEDIYFKIQNDN